MSEMIERVAAAMLTAEAEWVRREFVGMEDLAIKNFAPLAAAMARAAIEAMREPTKQMVDAGMIHCGVDLASEYRSMIDEALK